MDHPHRSRGPSQLFLHSGLSLVHTHAAHIERVPAGAHLGPGSGIGPSLHLHHRLGRRLRFAAIQAFHSRELHRAAHHAAAHGELTAVVRNRQHLRRLAKGQKPDSLPRHRSPSRQGLAALVFGAVTVLKPAQALSCLTCCFAISAVIPQAPDQGSHLLLPIPDRAFQPLTPLLLALGRLLFLFLPSLEQFVMEQLRAGQQSCGIFRRRLLTLPLFLQTPDHAVHLTISRRCQQLACFLQHTGIQTEPAGNRQGIAATRDSPEQLIGGGQGLRVEGHRGVLKAGIVVFERLEFAEMRGGDGEPSTIGQSLQQRARQGRALTGVGPGPHLIEQHQGWRGTGLQRLQNPPDPLDVTAEGGQALLQRLFIADIRQHLGTPGKGRRPCTGQQHPRPGHQGRQTDAFEGHRFTAGVRTGDRHHPQVSGHLHGDRHHRGPA